MAHNLKNKAIIRLDSINIQLNEMSNILQQQQILLSDQILQNNKILHQSKIHNMYKAHENDFIIDDNIFENDEIS